MTSVTFSLSASQRYGLMLLALLQGVLLYGLQESLEAKVWPATHHPVLYAAYAICVVAPLFITLLFGTIHKRALLGWSAALLLLVTAISAYSGAQLQPVEQVRDGGATAQLVLSVMLLSFIAVVLAQTGWRTDLPVNRQRVSSSWHYALLLGCAGLFVLAVAALLLLWAALFEAIGIDFFENLFSESWFLYPAMALANAVAILLLRERESVFTALGHLHTSLMRLLLILVSVITILFAVSLPFTGLEALWDKGGSTLILCLQALVLFLLNSVYLSHLSQPYGRRIQTLVMVALLIMPVYCVISVYGLSERISQYGLTVARQWGLIIWAMLALLAVGYALSWLRWRQHWVEHIGRINLLAALLLMLILVLANSPLLDLRQQAVDSQLARWQSGSIEASDLDLDYLEYDLARPGFLALQQLQQELKQSHPAMALSIYQRLHRTEDKASPELVQQAITGSEQAPAELLDKLQQDLSGDQWRQQATAWRLQPLDVNADGQQEFLLLGHHAHGQQLTLYYSDNGRWHSHDVQVHDYDPQAKPVQIEDEIQVVKPDWMDLQVGGQRFRVMD